MEFNRLYQSNFVCNLDTVLYRENGLTQSFYLLEMKKVISMKVLFKSNIRFLKVIYLVPWYLRHDNKCQTFVYKTVANIVFTFNSLATLYIWQLCTSGNSVHLATLYIWQLCTSGFSMNALQLNTPRLPLMGTSRKRISGISKMSFSYT